MPMQTFIMEAHSGWRHLVILILAIAILRAAYGWLRGSEWGAWDNRLGILTPIMVDIQLLLGLVLYIMGAYWNFPPLYAYEHPFLMFVAVITAHLTWVLVKQQTASSDKFRITTIGVAATLVVVTLGVLRITHVF